MVSRFGLFAFPMAGLLAGIVALGASTAFAAPEPEPEADHGIEGVRAAEANWSKAFLEGDEAYLERLLDPFYVSVGQSGSGRSKADIIALSRQIAAMPARPRPPKTEPAIVVHGDAAVVTSISDGDASVDVFYYDGARWRAWYSQHTPVKPPAAAG